MCLDQFSLFHQMFCWSLSSTFAKWQPHDKVRWHGVVWHLVADAGEMSLQFRDRSEVGGTAVDEEMEPIEEAEDLKRIDAKDTKRDIIRYNRI